MSTRRLLFQQACTIIKHVDQYKLDIIIISSNVACCHHDIAEIHSYNSFGPYMEVTILLQLTCIGIFIYFVVICYVRY